MATSLPRRATLAAALLAFALALASCGDDDESTAGNGGSDGGNGTIGVSVPTVQGPFFTAMIYGMKDEAEKLGYTLEIRDAGGYGNVEQQASQMENLVVQQVDALLVDPADAQTLEGSLQQAKAAGIPVVGAGDPFPGADTSVTASHCDVGKSMAEGAKQLLPDGGTMAALTGPPGAVWTTERWKCFQQDIEGAGIEIVADQSSEPAVEQGVAIASDFLQRYPDLDLLYGADDTVGVGAAQAVQEADRCGETKVLTAVFGRQAEQLMKAGCVNYIAALPTVAIGRRSVQEAHKLIQGETPESEVISIPLVPVTEENVDSVNVEDLREPDDYQP